MNRDRFACTLIAALFFAAFLCAAGHAAPSVKTIFDGMKKINPGLNDYSSQIAITIDAKWGFVSYTPTMQGNYYFKKPDKHKLELTKAPSYLKKYPQVFGWSLPDPDQFKNRIVKEETVAGQSCWVIEMVPKQQSGDLVRQLLSVGKKDFMIYRQQYFYRNAGAITVDMQYDKVGKYQLFKSMKSTFSFPSVKISAGVEATYSNYKVNTGLKDSFFKK